MVETIKMSSKGQIVIPQDIRREINAQEGTLFAAITSKDTIILKKIFRPSKEELLKELEKVSSENKKALRSKGFTESDLRKTRRIHT